MGGLVRGRPGDRARQVAWFVSILVWAASGGQGRRGIGAGSYRIIFGQAFK
ncbi:hypothetical protein [Achromobacter marplatensis]|uniref:hypothetical protein n=1 Tax=Achromobacter marplatensis TaxID=470868 RepID=UPI0039F64D23